MSNGANCPSSSKRHHVPEDVSRWGRKKELISFREEATRQDLSIVVFLWAKINTCGLFKDIPEESSRSKTAKQGTHTIRMDRLHPSPVTLGQHSIAYLLLMLVCSLDE